MPWGDRSRQERGYGREWEKARAPIIARDKGLCQPCLRAGRATPFKEVDHLKPKHMGGTDDPDNLQCICMDCHTAKTNRESANAKDHTTRNPPKFTADGQLIW